MKFLITNSVPLNGGDEALLRALITALACRWPESEVTVLCKDVDRCRQQLPDLDLNSDLEFAKSPEERSNTLECYRAADIVLSAPGGFLHDHYGIEKRLRGFELALNMAKPVMLVGQSIGPFWKRRSIKRVREVLNRVSRICLRDEISRQHLVRCGVDPSKIRITADVAFLWHEMACCARSATDEQSSLIGLSFRVWPLGDKVQVRETVAKAEALCRHILDNSKRRILFISTCQGIPGYVDDSELASQIWTRLPEDLRRRCEIDSQRYAPMELIRALGQCSAFIGMRLHACILAMIAGVPAMGLGYEDKTEQIFRQMGLEQYQTHFDTSVQRWIGTADPFLANTSAIREHLGKALEVQRIAASQNIDEIAEEVSAIIRHKPMTPEQRWSDSVHKYGQPHLRLRQVAVLVNELSPRRVLDIGCATGHLRTLCPGVDYVGCDFIAPAPPVEFAFCQCNFNREHLPDFLNGFDVIVCSGILEYIEDISSFLANLRSRLNEGGHVVLTYFNMNHISRVVALVAGRSFPVHPDWRGFHSPNTIRNLVEKNGFQIVRAVPMNHALGNAVSVEETVSEPLNLPENHWWSIFLAHQFLFVVKSATPETQAAGVAPPRSSAATA